MNRTQLLVNLDDVGFAGRLDVRYATADNIAGKALYRSATIFLHGEAADRLLKAQSMAQVLGLDLVVFDGYRPPETQWALWNVFPDPAFVADPRRGSTHTRGIAVDVTLAQCGGDPLPMGTGFDDMTAASNHGETSIGPQALRNRSILCGIMIAAGFDAYAPEWWHYQVPDARSYPLIADGAAAPRLSIGSSIP